MSRQIITRDREPSRTNTAGSNNPNLKPHYLNNNKARQPGQTRLRAKTFGDIKPNPYPTTTLPGLQSQTPPLIDSSQHKLFHPDIYHKPGLRKKYFCELIDSYMNRKTVQATVKRKVYKNISLNKRYEIVHEEGSPAYMNSQNNSPVKRTQQKRAMTAGSRRVATESVKVKGLKEDSQGDLEDMEYGNVEKKIKQTEQKNQSILIEDSFEGKVMRNSNKIYSKMQMLKSYMKNNKNTLKNWQGRVRTIHRTQNDIDFNNNSMTSQSRSNSKSHSNSQGRNQQDSIQKKLKTINADSKSRLRTISQFQKSNANLSNFSRSSSKFINLKDRSHMNFDLSLLEKQINQRIKLSILREKEKEWLLDCMYEHALYTVYYLIQKDSFINDRGKGKQKIRIKKFKTNFQAEKMQNTIDKIRDSGVSQLWTPLPKGQSKELSQLYFSPCIRSLRQQLFHFTRQQKTPSSSTPLLNIQLTPSYHSLFHNNCQQFRDLITSLAIDLTKMKGNMLNNRISLDNVYRMGEKCIRVGDWGSAAVSRRIFVGGKEVTFRDQPILMVDYGDIQGGEQEEGEQEMGKKWLINPQNLAPEVIQSLISGSYNRVWNLGGCPEIWCLGLIIFQILTCIPVWMPYQSVLNHNIPKTGCLYDRQKRLPQILANQQKIPTLISKWIRDNKGLSLFKQTHPILISIMRSALQINPRVRPTPEEIIDKLRVSL